MDTIAMTFEEYAGPEPKIRIHLQIWWVRKEAWHAAQEAMRERATTALRERAEQFYNDKYHGAAEIVSALEVE